MNGHGPSTHDYQYAQANMSRAGALGRNDFAPGTDPAPPIGVHDSISEQRGTITELHQIVSQIEERLNTVLRQNPTISGSAEGKAPEPMQVVHRIQDNTRSLRAVSERLQSIFQRIEL